MNCSRYQKLNPILESLSQIVGLYKTHYAAGAEKELRFYKIQKNLHDAIVMAALSKLPSGNRHSHQRRIPESQLIKAKNELQKANLQQCKDFHELFESVQKCIGTIYKIGELAVYDIAHRIGAHLNLEPERVYIHAGTRVGAKALKIRSNYPFLFMSQLPKPFHSLKPYEVEDCLCIFKREIAKSMNI